MQRPRNLSSRADACAPWTRPSRRATCWRTVAALLMGALLGVLAGMRYDLALGLPEGASAVLQSLAFTATWTWMGSGSLAQREDALHLSPDDLSPTGDDPGALS
ncbi:MAG: hypothetical protein JXA09_06545 [Anaerolineae bacterium]|nr:hypothetical protein [Anaerolineae bacterium]